MYTSEEIQDIVNENFKRFIQHSFQELIETTPGLPVPVFDEHKVQQYWLIPFLLNAKVRGSAIYDISGKLVSQGVLTPHVHDEHLWIDSHYFERVPGKFLDEILTFYADYKIVSHFFSFDLTPKKWGWLIRLKDDNNEKFVNVFVGPAGWYEKKVQTGFEG